MKNMMTSSEIDSIDRFPCVTKKLDQFRWFPEENVLKCTNRIFSKDEWDDAIRKENGFWIISHVTGRIVRYSKIRIYYPPKTGLGYEYISAEPHWSTDKERPMVKIFPTYSSF